MHKFIVIGFQRHVSHKLSLPKGMCSLSLMLFLKLPFHYFPQMHALNSDWLCVRLCVYTCVRVRVCWVIWII